ncbi:MAG: hypothetical protein ACXWTW_08360 [Methylobacter sp.]
MSLDSYRRVGHGRLFFFVTEAVQGELMAALADPCGDKSRQCHGDEHSRGVIATVIATFLARAESKTLKKKPSTNEGRIHSERRYFHPC